jgi:bifunctional non-homologous end joining protein LigD
MSATKTQLNIDGINIEVSNLGKVFYPKSGFTKGQVIDYYVRISPYLLPHLKNRPVTLKRYPNGADGFFFYEKNCPSPPEWVHTTKVPRSEGGEISYCVLDSLPSLIWAANLADLELHTFLHRAPALNRPTALAFDLDPGAPADVIACCGVAIQLHDLFAALKMECFPKTSGSKGLQVYVPLNTPTSYEKTKSFAHAVAELLERRQPGLIVSKMLKVLRKGKVLVDWSQNDSHKTTVNVYSLRAVERSLVSTPVTWDEIRKAIREKQASSLQFETCDVLRRVKAKGDLFAPVLTLKQKLPPLSALS